MGETPIPLLKGARASSPQSPRPQAPSLSGSERKCRPTPFDVLLIRPSETPWASLAQPQPLAPTHFFTRPLNLPSRRQAPRTPRKAPIRGGKFTPNPHGHAQVGRLLPTRQALKPHRPRSGSQLPPTPRTWRQDLVLWRPAIRLRSRRPSCGDPEILSLLGGKKGSVFALFRVYSGSGIRWLVGLRSAVT